MLFSSMTFIGVFLPIVVFLYVISKKELHNFILLFASIIFYAWGEPKYLAIMLLTIIANYFGAIAIDKFPKHKKFALISTILVNLSFLIYFKYFNFLIENCNNLFHSNIKALDIVMPIGISFYTFQAISYVIDVYRKDCKVQNDIYKLALYICLFPQLIAGPIVKYHDVAQQIESREVTFDKVCYGTKRFIIGLSKKMLLANTMGAIADKIFVQNPDTFSQPIAWLGSIAYSLQLYFDFSGYSDMAIGLGMIFGFRFLENFNYPYISKSVTEFWRRWHISLSTWFRDYVYIPLGGNRKGIKRQILNLFIVWSLTGIWHGAATNFLLWGLYYFAFLVLEKFVLKKLLDKLPSWVGHVYALFVVLIGWVLFRAEGMRECAHILKAMFIPYITNTTYAQLGIYLQSYAFYLISGILLAMPVFPKIKEWINTKFKENISVKVIYYVFVLGIFVLSIIFLSQATYNPFIYFRF